MGGKLYQVHSTSGHHTGIVSWMNTQYFLDPPLIKIVETRMAVSRVHTSALQSNSVLTNRYQPPTYARFFFFSFQEIHA